MNFLDSFIWNGLATVKVSSKIQKNFELGANLWRLFCTLPRHVKESFAYEDHQVIKDPGFRLRSSQHGKDNKQYFHYLADNQRYVEIDGLQRQLENFPIIQTFFDYCADLHSSIYPLVVEIAQHLEQYSPGIAEEVEDSLDHIVYRFLQYTPHPNEHVLAQPHCDRNGFTLQLYESEPGLQFMHDGNWSDVIQVPANELVLFPAYKLEKISAGKIQGSIHRVIRGPNTDQRVAIVVFAPIPSVPNEAYQEERDHLEL